MSFVFFVRFYSTLRKNAKYLFFCCGFFSFISLLSCFFRGVILLLSRERNYAIAHSFTYTETRATGSLFVHFARFECCQLAGWLAFLIIHCLLFFVVACMSNGSVFYICGVAGDGDYNISFFCFKCFFFVYITFQCRSLYQISFDYNNNNIDLNFILNLPLLLFLLILYAMREIKSPTVYNTSERLLSFHFFFSSFFVCKY